MATESPRIKRAMDYVVSTRKLPVGDELSSDLLKHLETDDAWRKYQRDIFAKIDGVRAVVGIDSESTQHQPAQPEKAKSKPHVKQAIDDLNKLVEKRKAIKRVNSLKQKPDDLMKIIYEAEIEEYFPTYHALQNEYKEKLNKIEEIKKQNIENEKVKLGQLEYDQSVLEKQLQQDEIKNDPEKLANKQLELNEILKQINDIKDRNPIKIARLEYDASVLHSQLETERKKDHTLYSLTNSLHAIEQQKASTTDTQHLIDHVVDLPLEISELSELSMDSTYSANEIVMTTQINVNDVSGLQGSSLTSTSPVSSSNATTPPEELGAVAMRVIPLVSEFIRGVNYLRDAYRAWTNEKTEQRKTRIGAGLFGGSVTLGSFTVGALMFGGVGLLATAPALFITPIVVAAVAMGVCAVALYRDSYIMHQANMRVKRMELELGSKLVEMSDAEDAIRMRCILANPDSDLCKTQNELNAKRAELAQAKENKNEIAQPRIKAEIFALEDKLSKLTSKPAFMEKLKIALQNDPRIARLNIEQMSVAEAFNKTKAARTEARRNVILGAISVAAFGIALGAVLATGVGALALSIAATAIFLSVTVTRVHAIYKARHAAKKQKEALDAAQKADAEINELDHEIVLRPSQKHAGNSSSVAARLSGPKVSDQRDSLCDQIVNTDAAAHDAQLISSSSAKDGLREEAKVTAHQGITVARKQSVANSEHEPKEDDDADANVLKHS